MQYGRIHFRGHFGSYILGALLCLLLTFVTFGLALPYFIYWNSKYFVNHLELEMYPEDVRPPE